MAHSVDSFHMAVCFTRQAARWTQFPPGNYNKTKIIIIQWNLTNPNSLGPAPVRISEIFGLVHNNEYHYNYYEYN